MSNNEDYNNRTRILMYERTVMEKIDRELKRIEGKKYLMGFHKTLIAYLIFFRAVNFIFLYTMKTLL